MAEPEPIYEATKDPNSRLDYGFDWASAGWLADCPGDTIADGSNLPAMPAPLWTITSEGEDAPLALEVYDEVLAVAITTVWLTGGTEGVDYIVTCRVTLTPSGRIDERSMRICCRNR